MYSWFYEKNKERLKIKNKKELAGYVDVLVKDDLLYHFESSKDRFENLSFYASEILQIYKESINKFFK